MCSGVRLRKEHHKREIETTIADKRLEILARFLGLKVTDEHRRAAEQRRPMAWYNEGHLSPGTSQVRFWPDSGRVLLDLDWDTAAAVLYAYHDATSTPKAPTP